MNPRSPNETSVPTLRERIRQATASAILDAAEQVFAEQGLEGVRMNDIAARAGVAVGTLYNHFEDRQALVNGLLMKRKLDVMEMLDGVLDEHGLDFRARLEHAFDVFFRYAERHRGFYNLYMQCEASASPALSNDLAREIYVRMEKLAKRGLKEKVLRPSGADLYPALLMGIIRALFLRERLYDIPLTRPDVKEALRFFFEGAGVT
jgi:AcrR family transcriptional regulator